MLCFQSVLYCIVLYNDVFTSLYVAVGNKLLLLLPFPIYQYSRVNKGTVTTMPICDRSVQDLRRHLITTHKHNKRVKAIINDESSGRITEQQRIHAFNQLKKEGIQQKNR